MPIRFVCAQCGSTLSCPYTAAGKPVTCDACHAATTAPKEYSAPTLGNAKTPATESEPPPRPVDDRRETPHEKFEILRRLSPSDETSWPPRSSLESPQVTDAPIPAPATVAELETRPTKLRPTEISASEILKRSRLIFERHTLACLAGYWSSTLFIYGSRHVLEQLLAQQAPSGRPLGANPLILITVFVASLLCSGWLACGLTRYMLKLARDERPSIAVIVLQGRGVLRVYAAALLVMIPMVLFLGFCAVPAPLIYFAARDEWVAGLAGVISIEAAVAGLIWGSVTFSQFLYLIVDRNSGPLQSLFVSFRLTQGNRVSLLLLSLLSFLSPLSILVCGIGILFFLPYMMLVAAVAYLEMTGELAPRPTNDWSVEYAAPSAGRREERSGGRSVRPRSYAAVWIWLFMIAVGLVACFGYQSWLLKGRHLRWKDAFPPAKRTWNIRDPNPFAPWNQ